MTTPSKHTLEQGLLIIEALVPLLIRSGIGYSEFASASKPIFYRQALIEAERTSQKNTDSTISLLAGLHRRDTANLRKAVIDDPSLANAPISKPVSVPKQVLSVWLSSELPETIPIQGATDSFAFLVETISKDQHHRSILNELERLGIVAIEDTYVTLKRKAYTPNPQLNESKEQFSQNVADHISAGLYNLFSDPSLGDKGILEQAIFSDELTLKSTQKLEELANELWSQALNTILKEAISLHKKDQVIFSKTDNEKPYRFRLGMYTYHTKDSKNNNSSET